MSAPNWDLLPQDPQGFFELDDDFDRRQLKRSYGKLIRQFKPESHPQEFQQIRQAYEQLESQLRYGVKQVIAQTQADAWTSAANQARTAPVPSATSDATSSQPQTESSLQRTIDKPAETYKALRSATHRTPQDYFRLAVLSDAVQKKDRMLFAKWLIQGLKEYPTDPGLQSLLTGYLQEDVPTEKAPGVLLAIAKTVPGDLFYRLTESLWDRVLDKLPFETFESTLAQCQRTLLRESPFHQAAFYIHILKSALWKANSRWFDEAYEFVQQMGADLDAASDIELEFLDLLRVYHRDCRKNLSSDETLKKIDQMIQDYCSPDWRKSAATATRVLDKLARNSYGVMAAFPVSDDEATQTRSLLCMMIASDVGEMVGVHVGQISEKRTIQQAHTTVKDLRESMEKIYQKLGWISWRNYFVYIAFPALVPWIFLWGRVSTPVLLGVTAVLLALLFPVFYFVLKPWFVERRTHAKVHRVLLQTYNASWRPRLFRYVQSVAIGSDIAIAKLYEAGEETHDQEWLGLVISYMQRDTGLALFGRAQLFTA